MVKGFFNFAADKGGEMSWSGDRETDETSNRNRNIYFFCCFLSITYGLQTQICESSPAIFKSVKRRAFPHRAAATVLYPGQDELHLKVELTSHKTPG